MDQLLQSLNGSALEFEHRSTTSQKKTLLIKARALSTDGSRVLLLMMEDITLRRDAEILISKQKEALQGEIEVTARKLTRTQEELRGLTAHLFTVQEEEREHVARELHDDISQRLSHLEIRRGSASRAGSPRSIACLNLPGEPLNR
jgi:signal transduction histidine kinase